VPWQVAARLAAAPHNPGPAAAPGGTAAPDPASPEGSAGGAAAADVYDRRPEPTHSDRADRDLTTIAWAGSAAAAGAALAAAPTPLVALVLDASPPPTGWAADALPLFAGPRVDAVVGAGLPAGAPPPAAFLRSRSMDRRAYRPLGPPPRFLIVRGERLAAVGGFGQRADGLGPHAAIAELVERLLDAGGLIAGLDLAAFERPASGRARAQAELVRARDRGGLVWRRAAERGGAAGPLWVARTEVAPALARTVRGGMRSRALELGQLAALLSAAASARRPALPHRAARD
jgi:hypothetical protein